MQYYNNAYVTINIVIKSVIKSAVLGFQTVSQFNSLKISKKRCHDLIL